MSDKTNSKELKKYRIKLFRDASGFNKPERIPHYANVVTWKIFDAGYTPAEAMTDFGVMEKCVRHFLEKYPVDAMMDVGVRNQFNVTEAFSDEGYYYYNEEAVGIHDHSYCGVEELDELLYNKDRFIWEKALPRKYSDWYEKPLDVWQKAFDEYLKYMKFIFKVNSITAKEYGLPSGAPNNPMSGKIDFGIEQLEASVLGIKELSIALRRNYDKIKNFVEVYDERMITPVIKKLRAGKPGANLKYCFDSSMMMLAHNILSVKQFDALYRPYLDKLLGACSETKKTIRIYAEGSIMRFSDYFNTAAKGTVTLHIENDDPYEIRRAMPGCAIMGGITTDLLKRGSVEECVNYTKKLADELGGDGGLILSEGKMLSYRNDAKSENLKAVCDFISTYTLK